MPAVKISHEYQRLSMAALRERWRNAAHAAYGGKCVCCGESNPAFLTIDHVNEDGAAHRKALNAQAGLYIYDWLRKQGYPDGFQLLCFNCNCARSMRGDGVCPHQRPVDPGAAQKRFDEHRAGRKGRHLTDKEIDEIEWLLAEGFQGRAIAKALGVSEANVSLIKHGKRGG